MHTVKTVQSGPVVEIIRSSEIKTISGFGLVVERKWCRCPHIKSDKGGFLSKTLRPHIESVLVIMSSALARCKQLEAFGPPTNGRYEGMKVEAPFFGLL